MESKKVLVVPLNWGLGHTTRLIPVIRELLKYNVEILFGGGSVQEKLMKEEFKSLHYIPSPFFKVRFGKKRFLFFSLLLQLPRFVIQIFNAHFFLRKLINKENIGLVISDNVYGLWSSRVYTVFITHQLNIQLPRSLTRIQSLVNRINHRFISKYNECWIPDIEDNQGLAGILSHPMRMPGNCKYIGLLSRFDEVRKRSSPGKMKKNSILILFSGPEPQRTIFEDLIKEEIPSLPAEMECKVIRGLPDHTEIHLPGWKNHVPARELAELIRQSEFIICRSGYSTIMDLAVLKKTALLIPTPGQTEQEYLAQYLKGKNWFNWMDQEDFSLSGAIKILQQDSKRIPFDASEYTSLLSDSIKNMLGSFL
jgi:spore coat polysaccharide biosynthesis predicted glycosyltransferase SpsG